MGKSTVRAKIESDIRSLQELSGRTYYINAMDEALMELRKENLQLRDQINELDQLVHKQQQFIRTSVARLTLDEMLDDLED